MEDKVLRDLYNAVADELLRKIQSGEASAAELNVARAFLKDNGIDATPGQSKPLANLAESLPFNIDIA